MLCALILYVSGGTHSLKSFSNVRFLGRIFTAILFLLSEEVAEETIFILNHDLTSNKPTHYLKDYGDFYHIFCQKSAEKDTMPDFS